MRNLVSAVSRIAVVSLLGLLFLQNDAHCADDQPTKTSEKPTVIARVNGVDITEPMLLKEIDRAARAGGGGISATRPANKEQAFFSVALDRAIDSALLISVAQTQGITVAATEVNQGISILRKRFPSEKEFNRVLASQGISEQDLRQILKERLLPKKVLEANVKAPTPPTDEAVQEFYTSHPQYFEQPEQCKASHILLRVPDGASKEEKEKIKQKLLSVRTDIEKKKITFEDAAKQSSEDPGSAPRGGDLGFFSRGKMVKPFEEAAFSTPVGEMSDVIESQFGFHLIKVTGHKKGEKISLEKAKDKIAHYLSQQDYQKAIKEYITGLREKAKIETLVSKEEWNARHASKNPPIQVNPNSAEPKK